MAGIRPNIWSEYAVRTKDGYLTRCVVPASGHYVFPVI